MAEHTFRPPWYHMNIMCEFMGLIYGATTPSRRASCPAASACTTACCRTARTSEAFERASKAELKPHKLDDTMAFMFETRFPQRLTRYAAELPERQAEYGAYGAKLQKHFNPDRREP